MKSLPFHLALLGICSAIFTQSAANAVELRVTRAALERTLRQQLFGPTGVGRYYLSGSASSACPVYAESASVSFVGDRILVRVDTRAKIGKGIAGKCVGISLAPTAEVSMLPEAEGETIGFIDARVVQVSDSRELNFLLMPFLGRKVPTSMKVNAADLLRKAISDSTAKTGYQITLDRLKIHSMQIEGDTLIVDVDGTVSMK